MNRTITVKVSDIVSIVFIMATFIGAAVGLLFGATLKLTLIIVFAILWGRLSVLLEGWRPLTNDNKPSITKE